MSSRPAGGYRETLPHKDKKKKSEAQLSLEKCLPSMHGILGLTPSTTQHKVHVVAVHAYNPSTWVVEDQKSKVVLRYTAEFSISLGYVTPHFLPLKKERKKC